MDTKATIKRIEQLIHVDPGNRGLGKIWTELEENGRDDLLFRLWDATESLYNSKTVFVLTGFYILSAGTIETDGPPGAFAIARALWRLRKRVFILIDHSGGAQLLEEVINEAKSSLSSGDDHVAPSVILCPPRSATEDYETFMSNLMDLHRPDHIVAIERPCRAKDEKYHNMRGLDVTEHTAPLDWMFLEAKNRSLRTIGIGDGGNEIGMLNLEPYIVKHVPNGPVLASAIGCDHLISAGVSNWGGYAIAAALFALHRDRSGESADAILVDLELEKKLIRLMTEKYGIVDGPLAKVAPFVDGLPFDPDHLDLIKKLEKVARS